MTYSLANSSPSTGSSVKRLNLYLIKPTKYDDDGYVVRHLLGVLPSNTLACLYGLSEDVRTRGALGENLKWNIEALDETAQKIPFKKILRESRRKNSKTVVALVGVQSNQFPRASDIAKALKQPGIEVLIGGFHVSGVLATLNKIPDDIRALQDLGVTIIAGEAEGRWEGILRDAIEGKLKPLYNYLSSLPDLATAPMPKIFKKLQRHYALPHFATLDCGRGCPFKCSFCTVINVQGRSMRFRPVDAILKSIRENHKEHKIRSYFFTDDNFARNKNWEAIFDGMIAMRENEGIKIHFMMQADTLSYRIPNFVEKAKRAGCSQVFIGIESVNQKNLEAAGKKQNKISEFKDLIKAYRDAEIATHLAYITGFPFDTEESIRENVEWLQSEMAPEQTSFFMLTPLPGSEDYQKSIASGQIVDADLNNFDSCHQTFKHSLMADNSWTRAFNASWGSFYHIENLIKILKLVKPHKYLDIFWNFVWYKNSIEVEGGHPMLQGFVRVKGRHNRRPGYPVEARWPYYKRRLREIRQMFVGWIRLVMELEEVWLATRRRSALEENVVLQLDKWKTSATEWTKLSLMDLQRLYKQAALAVEKKAGVQRISIPSRFQLWIRKWNPFIDPLTHTRIPMNQFWEKALYELRRGNIARINFIRVFTMSVRETILLLRFCTSVMIDAAS